MGVSSRANAEIPGYKVCGVIGPGMREGMGKICCGSVPDLSGESPRDLAEGLCGIHIVSTSVRYAKGLRGLRRESMSGYSRFHGGYHFALTRSAD